MIVGFTGTRIGLTDYQRNTLRHFFSTEDWSDFHHGQCVGADEEAAELAMEWRAQDAEVVAYPCNLTHLVSKQFNYTSMESIDKPLTRNRRIVDACDILIACPKENLEISRSGTWFTVRYARQRKKKIMIIYPQE